MSKDDTLVLPPFNNKDLLMDATSQLWETTLRISSHVHSLRKTCIGKTIDSSDLNGTITDVSRSEITFRGSDGDTKKVPLTPKRVDQLFAATMRRK